jgi:RNA polymerase sigma-70 factor (ECF subfamily)
MSGKLKPVNIKKLREGDKETVRLWFIEYADQLYSLILHKVGKDENLACDIVQQTFVEALSKIKEYEPARGTMLSWLSCLSKNYTKKMLREKQRHLSYQQDNYSTNGELLETCTKITTQPLPEHIIERQETAELVRTTLTQLPDWYRKVLRQYYYQQKSIEEISNSEGKSAVALRILLYRARKAFKKQLLKSAKSADRIDLD